MKPVPPGVLPAVLLLLFLPTSESFASLYQSSSFHLAQSLCSKECWRISPRHVLHSGEDDNIDSTFNESPSSDESEIKADPTAKDNPSKPLSPPPVNTQRQAPPLESIGSRRSFLSSQMFVSTSLSTAFIAFGTNFLGCTSTVLNVLPEDLVEASRLDTYFPRGKYKRVRGGEYGYSFLIPKEWVADTALELAKAERRAKTLDYTMSSSKSNVGGVMPDAAFGPPGRLNARGVSKGDTNVSVIVSKVMPGFTLRGTLGTPTDAAESLLRNSIAPGGRTGRTATLIQAVEEERGASTVYQFEYDVVIVDPTKVNAGVNEDGQETEQVESGKRFRNISVIAERNGDTLLTLTIVAPAEDWLKDGEKLGRELRTVAQSFKLTR